MSNEQRNTGDWNTGDWNTGNLNTGYLNTGDWNTGYLNTGDWNTGDWNTGDWNTGNLNTGDWNTGDWNTGYFCEDTPPPMFFDRPTTLTRDEAISIIQDLPLDLRVGVEFVDEPNMSDTEKSQNPNHTTLGGFLRKHILPIKEVFPAAWAKLTDDEKSKWLALPNFDADKFLRMFGVDVRKKMGRVRLADGTVVTGEVLD